jgi:hypothetical protein
MACLRLLDAIHGTADEGDDLFDLMVARGILCLAGGFFFLGCT